MATIERVETVEEGNERRLDLMEQLLSLVDELHEIYGQTTAVCEKIEVERGHETLEEYLKIGGLSVGMLQIGGLRIAELRFVVGTMDDVGVDDTVDE